MLSYKEAIDILRKLKKIAKHIQENDEYILMSPLGHSVEDEKRAIVTILAKLDLD